MGRSKEKFLYGKESPTGDSRSSCTWHQRDLTAAMHRGRAAAEQIDELLAEAGF
jgi:hypothetical protein